MGGVEERGTLIKGASLTARLQYVEEEFGRGALARVLARLSPEDRYELEHRLLASSRYPLELNGRLDEAIAQEVDPGDPIGVYRRLGRASAEKNLRGVHSIFAQGEQPHSVLSRFPAVRATYYSDGEVTYEKTGESAAVLRITGASSHTRADCESTAAYFQRAIEILGGTGVDMEVRRCCDRGDTCCEIVYAWR